MSTGEFVAWSFTMLAAGVAIGFCVSGLLFKGQLFDDRQVGQVRNKKVVPDKFGDDGISLIDSRFRWHEGRDRHD